MKEIWKMVPSRPWIEASSLGRIRAVYEGIMPNGGWRNYVVEPTLGSVVTSRRGGKHKHRICRVRGETVKVHRLVCEAFHGPPPGSRLDVLHLDENGINNVPANLAWGTRQENLNMPKFLNYCTSRTGENSPVRKGLTRRAA